MTGAPPMDTVLLLVSALTAAYLCWVMVQPERF